MDGQGTTILGDFFAVFRLDTSLGFAAKRCDSIEVFPWREDPSRACCKVVGVGEVYREVLEYRVFLQ